jgi:hypothetical protein
VKRFQIDYEEEEAQHLKEEILSMVNSSPTLALENNTGGLGQTK